MRRRSGRRAGAASDQGQRRHRHESERSPPLTYAPSPQTAAAGPWSQPPPFHPSGQFHVLSSSPLALTPSLSPLYKAPAPSYFTGGRPGPSPPPPPQAMDETVGRIFMTYLPNFFDALAKFQFHQALASLEVQGKSDWRDWDAFQLMRKLAASCESTYHLMKYLEPDVLRSDAIDAMYSKLVVLLNHLAEELKPMVARQRHFPVHVMDGGGGSMNGVASDDPLADGAMYGDLGYYAELLDQAAEFFSLRLSMVEMYRGLALATEPLNCGRMLDGLLMRFDAFDHPLLETMKQSAIEENRAVHAALQTEQRITQFDFTKSMIALHRLKKALASWSDHIDSLSDYPLFDDGGLGDLVDGDLDGGDDDDENNGLSDSMYSSASFAPGNSMPGAEPSSYLSRSNVRRPTSYSVASDHPGALVGDRDELHLVGRNASVMSVDSVTSAASEVQSTFSRLLSQSNLLTRGLVGSAVPIPVALRDMANLVQRPGDPYASSGSSVLTNTLEQAILGGSSGEPSHGASTATSAGAGTLSAAEMIALSMKRQERDDGFALPVFQWAKRFYRSLVAKFSLYFHQWLEPLERQGDFLSHDLTRFIRTPMGISYLQLMDVLLARGSYRGNDGRASIMLVLETDKLDDKGAHYYQNGYLCPSTSRGRSSQPEPEDPQHDSSSSTSTSGSGAALDEKQGVQEKPPPPVNHTLFMQVDTEREEEQSDFSPLWGLRSWPAVFCYPTKEPPLAHWPNIVSLIMDSQAALEAPRFVFVHTEKRLQATYYIARVDPCMYLVLLLEGKRRPSEKTTQDFMHTLTVNLQHGGAFDYSRSMSAAPSGSL
ncbi:hypothetical protein PybrP1_005362 [[Pythium] brassicae (nom. inval.)]|nr:hypothetical protein PybrP1_005362 [[Pythium] brassicae (nom. inval.)]